MFEEKAEPFKFGFRELFRIMIPGVWLLIVFSNTVSISLWNYISKIGIKYPDNLDNFKLIVLAWLLGFFWFSLQLPKKLGRYKKFVKHLKEFMLKLHDEEQKLVDKPVYDYYLAVILSSTARIRIHYFASMYYMAMDIAIISFVAFGLNIIFLLFKIILEENTFPVNYILTIHSNDLFLLLLLGGLAFIEKYSAKKFLNDVMIFSLYCLQVNKNELRDLIELAQTTDALQKMSNDF